MRLTCNSVEERGLEDRPPSIAYYTVLLITKNNRLVGAERRYLIGAMTSGGG